MIPIKDAHHVLAAYAGHRHQWSGDLGNLEDTVHQEAVLVLGLHPQFDLPFVATSVPTAYNELLPALRPRQWVEDASITGGISQIDNVVAASTVEGQQDVGLHEIIH